MNRTMFCNPFAPCTFQLPQFLINNVQRCVPGGTFQSGVLYSGFVELSAASWIT